MRLLITGGMGFVGSRLALNAKETWPEAEITCFDNLRRRGSERNIETLQARGINFVHGDIRNPGDFSGLGKFDVFIEASAEPSVHAGLDGSPAYVFETNLVGTFHCLEFARVHCKKLIFLSTSRVYSIENLRNISLTESGPHYSVADQQKEVGITALGISEGFSTASARSLYGATKLASELLIQEYGASYGLESVINRCGVIAGPGQFGKVDQGVFALWVAHHYFGKPLEYKGWKGKGLQVRDLMHPNDLFDLIRGQLAQWDQVKSGTFNAGGGPANAVSLAQWTSLCKKVTGKETTIRANNDTAAVDIPYYVSDNRKINAAIGWEPQRSAEIIAKEITDWIRNDEAQARKIFGI
jgi:CDP-paratose 2-epimerase